MPRRRSSDGLGAHGHLRFGNRGVSGGHRRLGGPPIHHRPRTDLERVLVWRMQRDGLVHLQRQRENRWRRHGLLQRPRRERDGWKRAVRTAARDHLGVHDRRGHARRHDPSTLRQCAVHHAVHRHAAREHDAVARMQTAAVHHRLLRHEGAGIRNVHSAQQRFERRLSRRIPQRVRQHGAHERAWKLRRELRDVWMSNGVGGRVHGHAARVWQRPERQLRRRDVRR